MTRDLSRLASDRFDLLVIGGGIYGLTAAWDATLRGLRVALVERGDFGAGTSFNHHKTLHGGLRYLQKLDLGRMRESIAERRAFARIAPGLIAPQAFAVATRGWLARSRLAMRAGLLVDRCVAADRNRDVPASLRLPAGRVIGREELAKLAPDLLRGDVTGAAVWHDYITTEGDRLTLSFALAAARRGAVLANYLDATAPLREGSRILGMRVRDGVSGEAFDVRAQVVLNAAGASAGRVMGAFGVRRAFPLLKAMNIVTRRPAPSIAMGAPTSEGRLLFALPWRGRLVVGTSHSHALAGADDVLARAKEVEAFVSEINSAFPSFALTLDDVTLVHRGVVPAASERGEPRLREHGGIQDHARDGIEGAISVVGVKYTTARRAAADAVTLAGRKLGRALVPSWSDRQPLDSDGGPVLPLTLGEWRHLGSLYDYEATERMAALVEQRPLLRERVVPDQPVIAAQVVEAIRHESALTLEDIVVRRTGLGAAGYPGEQAVHACALVAGTELGWSAERVGDEIDAVKRFYELV